MHSVNGAFGHGASAKPVSSHDRLAQLRAGRSASSLAGDIGKLPQHPVQVLEPFDGLGFFLAGRFVSPASAAHELP